jgi:hypothetical protein
MSAEVAVPFPSWLSVAHEQVRDELRRADAKATTLLSLVGAAMAGVIALANRDMTGAGVVLLWTSLVPIFASVVLLLVAIRPRLNPHPVPGTWQYAARVGPVTLLETCQDAESMTTADHVCVLARIARAKYQRIAVAIALLLGGLATLMVSLLAMAVAS